MNAVFDITELRANIGKDAEIERRLLRAFIDSAEESLALLAQQFPKQNDVAYNEFWKRHMHQLKGAAMNICAVNLTKITGDAQNQFAADLPAKKVLLESTLAEFANVKTAIGEIHIL